MTNKTSVDFNKWNIEEFLKMYYDSPTKNNTQDKLRFIQEQGEHINKANAKGLEIGSGPVICHFASLSKFVSNIYVSDYLGKNLNYIESILNNPNQSSIDLWENYLRIIFQSSSENSPLTNQEMIHHLSILRNKVSGYFECDIRLDNPLGVSHKKSYDCVMSLSCADSITDNKDLWEKYMKNIFSLIKPGGLFIGEVSKECHRYWVGDICYPVVWLTPQDCIELMVEFGFNEKELQIEVIDEIILMGGVLN